MNFKVPPRLRAWTEGSITQCPGRPQTRARRRPRSRVKLSDEDAGEREGREKESKEIRRGGGTFGVRGGGGVLESATRVGSPPAAQRQTLLASIVPHFTQKIPKFDINGSILRPGSPILSFHHFHFLPSDVNVSKNPFYRLL